MADDDDAAFFVSIGEIAASRGVSRQAVHKRLRRLEESGIKVEIRKSKTGETLIRVAEFDRATGEATDLSRSTRHAAPASAAEASASSAYTSAQTRKANYAADLARLELLERVGKLVPVEDVETVGDLIGGAVVAEIERLPSHADEMAAAVARDGVAGARLLFKKIAHALREAVAARIEAAVSPILSKVLDDGAAEHREGDR